MSRTDQTLTSSRGAAPSVVERLADLYSNNGGKSGPSGRPRRSRRSRRRSSPSYYGAPRKRSGPARWVVALVALAVLAAGLAVTALTMTWITVQVTGVEDGDIIRGDQLAHLELRVRAGGRGKGDVVVMLNGAELATTTDQDGVVVAPLSGATTGSNVVNYRVKSTLPWVHDKTGQIAFTVRFGPVLSVPRAVPPPTDKRPAVIRGLVDDDVIVTVNGKPAAREAGAFTARVNKGAREAVVVAKDANGNITKAVVKFEDTIIKGDAIQAFHVSSPMWRDPQVQQQLTDLASQHRINAVELTVKDEKGQIGYTSALPFAKEIGANANDYDARAAIDHIHSLGLKAVARIVCFLDPTLAQWAVKTGHTDMIIQNPDGTPLDSKYGTAVFANFGNPDVRQYNIDLAVEAASLGFDMVMYDYVRRPEGDMSKFKFPGLEQSPPVAVANFVRDSRKALPNSVKLGLAIFGISATRPIMIAQDVRLLAPLVDWISPMVYPGLWGPGEYKVPVPIDEPGTIVERSVRDFVRIASAGGAYTIPWLQDYTTPGHPYGSPEVTAQIQAALQAGASGYFLWNPRVVYHYDVFQPMSQASTTDTTVASSDSAPPATDTGQATDVTDGTDVTDSVAVNDTTPAPATDAPTPTS